MPQPKWLRTTIRFASPGTRGLLLERPGIGEVAQGLAHLCADGAPAPQRNRYAFGPDQPGGESAEDSEQAADDDHDAEHDEGIGRPTGIGGIDYMNHEGSVRQRGNER